MTAGGRGRVRSGRDVDRLRLAMVGAGWINRIHLDALDRLGRTSLVAVASAHEASAHAMAEPHVATAYTDLDRMLDEQRPDVVYVAAPPSEGIAVLDRLVERRIPFLAEKPLAATDSAGPVRVAAAIAASGIVAAVGYHLRSLDALVEVRDRLAADPAHLVVARWLDQTPGPAWWRREEHGGGQVIEQATHFYDLARHLVGEATVVGAASTVEAPAVPPDADVVDATAAVLRFASGAVGSFTNTRRLGSSAVAIELAAAGLLITIRRAGDEPGGWAVDLDDRGAVRTIPPGRDPYEAQAAAFLDAVASDAPDRVPSTYADALLTDRLTRAVVVATGRGG
jgi:myo-inositol 2-dehydrogenase/D-chiro-inositol 1-dehydrogenase